MKSKETIFPMSRRRFLGTMGTVAATQAMAAPLVAGLLGGLSGNSVTKGTSPGKTRALLHACDYLGVTLLPSRWQEQYASACDFYMGLVDDDVLHGFRAAAGLTAPGKPLGGWADPDSYVIFGQWLQAMARSARATRDSAMREKASFWVDEWAKTIGADRNIQLGHYTFEKMVGGLLDMHQYAGHLQALALLERITRWAVKNLNRDRVPANRAPWELHSGRPLEWYTVAENLYRAYALTGDPLYREFAEVWLYPAYWDKFLATAVPGDASGVHAYSHVNSFSSAAMAYEVSGDARYLQAMRNAYDFLQSTQCFATGGYGPVERIMPADGALGEALEQRVDSCEVPCCSWAGFKLAKYLIRFTGEARYGDWIERLLYNAIGAALPIVANGRHFYYASYHLGAAMKTYSRNTFTCCSGTYFQNLAEYRDLIYFTDHDGLYVNLYLPSEFEWEEGRVVLTTRYPEADTVSIRFAPLRGKHRRPLAFQFRVPGWSLGMTVALNGVVQKIPIEPGKWATLCRIWQPNDEVRLNIPLHFRHQAVDRQHPDRVALMRGPVVYAQEVVHKAMSLIPASDEELDRLMVPLPEDPSLFRIANEEVVGFRNAFLPFYRYPEVTAYRMYFDPSLRRELW